MPGIWEGIVVLMIILLVFPRRLHAAARGLGESCGLVRRCVDDD